MSATQPIKHASTVMGQAGIPAATTATATHPAAANAPTAHSPIRTKALNLLKAKQGTYQPINWTQFALMNNASLIRGSALDRGTYITSCNCAYSEYLTLLENSPFFSFKDATHIIKTLKGLLANLEALRLCYPFSRLDRILNENELQVCVKSLQGAIEEQLKVNGFVYATFGYSGKEGKQGSSHALVCKMVRQGNDIVVSFFNLGEGAENHPDLDVSTTQYLSSYSYYPVRVAANDWAAKIPLFLSHLIRYISDTPPKNEAQYRSVELYDLLHVLGDIEPSLLTAAADQLKAKLQTVGDCADKSIRNVLKDFLVSQAKLDSNEIERIFLNIHFCSLIAAYNSFLYGVFPLNGHEHFQTLLKDAAEQQGLRLLRAKNLLKPEEFYLAAEIIDVILSETNKAKASPVNLPAAPMPQPAKSFATKRQPETLKLELRKRGRDIFQAPAFIHKAFKQPFVFKPTQFKTDLAAWLASALGCEYLSYYYLARSFPIPVFDDPQDPWKMIAEADIKEILANIKVLMETCCKLPPRSILIAYSLYAIAVQLALRLPSLQLDGFSLPFDLGQSENILILHGSDEQKRWGDLKSFFSSLPKGKLIFPREIFINLLDSEIAEGKQTQRTNHLKYLEKLKPQLKTVQDFAKFWREEAPLELNSLYECCCLAKDASAFEYGNDFMKHLSTYKTSNANELLFEVTAYPHDRSLPLETIEDLAKIVRYPNLKLGLALSWIQSNWKQLNLYQVQIALECCFFTHNALKEAITTNPETITEFRAMIQKGLSKFQNKKEFADHLFFIIRLSLLFETSISEILNQPLDEAPLEKYKLLLKNSLSRFDLENENEELKHIWRLCELIFIDFYRELKTEEDFIDLYTHFFKYQILTSGIFTLYPPPQISSFIQHCSYLFFVKFEKFLSKKREQKEVVLSRILNAVMKNIIPHYRPAIDPRYTLERNLAKSEDFILDLSAIAISHPNRQLSYRLTRVTKMERAFTDMDSYKLNDDIYWWLGMTNHMDNFNDVLISVDRKSWFFLNREFKLGNRLFQTNAKEALELNMASYDAQESDSLPIDTAVFAYTIALKDQTTKKTTVLATRHGTSKPYFQIDYVSDQAEVTLLDEKGTKQTAKLANLQHLPATHPLYSWTLKFAKADEVLCFLNDVTYQANDVLPLLNAHTKQGGEILSFLNDPSEQIDELYFTSLNLRFTRDERGLASQDYFGFYLTQLELRHLGKLSKEALVLRAHSGKIKVIIPFPEKEKKDLGFDDETNALQERKELPKFFIYDLEEANESLEPQTYSEKLFLVYFFRSRGDFQRAEFELKKLANLQLPDRLTFEVLARFLDLKDKSRSALCFHMKLLLFVCEHYTTWAKVDAKSCNRFLQEAQYLHTLYLEVLSDDKVAGIAEKDRISEVEEARILATFKREKIPTYKILDAREKMFHSLSRSAAVTFYPEAISLAPSLYKTLLPPDTIYQIVSDSDKATAAIVYPNRLHPHYITAHFEELYEKARKTKPGKPDPFDYTLLAILKSPQIANQSHEFHIKNAHALFYVRHFPEVFADLPFRKSQDETNAHVIASRIQNLRNHPRFQEFVKNVVMRDVHFEVFKRNTIIIATQEQIAAFEKSTQEKVLNFNYNRLKTKDLKGKEGSTVTVEEFKEFEFFINTQHGENKQQFQEFAKTLNVSDIKLVKLPVDLKLLTQRHEVLLVTAAEFETIRAQAAGHSVMRFSGQATLKTLKEAVSYTKTIALPPKVDYPPLPAPLRLKFEKTPFIEQRKRLFKEIPVAVGKAGSLFELDGQENAIEKELVAKYEMANQKLLSQKRVSYELQTSELAAVNQSLKQGRGPLQEAIASSRKKIERYLNDPHTAFEIAPSSAEAKLFQLSLNSGHTYHLTAEQVLKEVVLQNDRSLLEKQRPMLKSHHIQVIIGEINHLTHLQVLDKMHNEACELIAKLIVNPQDLACQNELLALLNYEFLYEPEKFPEIGYFKLKVGKLPRPEQTIIYKWVCEGFAKKENRLFQLPAGGGKTTLMVPLLIMHLKRYKVMPVVMTTQAICPVEKENLRQVLHQLDEGLGNFDLEMNTELTLEEAKRLLDDMKYLISKRRAVITTPQTYYALRLQFFTASCDDHQKEKAEELNKILSLLKNYGTLLGDESHRTVDPHTQAVFGIGEQKKLRFRHTLLLSELMKPIMGSKTVLCDNGKEVFELVNLQESSQSSPKKEEIALIQKALAKEAAALLLSKVPQALVEALTHFWLNSKALLPALPATLTAGDRELILLTRFFLLKLLPQILTMKIGYDHLPSESQGGIDTPAHNKNPSHAQFKDPYLTFVLSIKGTMMRGLTEDQFEKLIVELQKQDSHESDLMPDAEESLISKQFAKWVQALAPKPTLSSISIKKDAALMEKLFNHLKKNKEVLQWYLAVKILSEIGHSEEEFTATPSQVANGFSLSCLFSATPLALEAYPRAITGYQLDEIFEAEVIAKAYEKQNQNFLFPDNIQSFFTHMFANRDLYKDVFALIGAGEFLCDMTNASVAENWLNASGLDGILYFREEDEKFAFVFGTMTGPKVIALKATTTERIKIELLKEHDLDFDKMRVGTYYDASHAESANIAQKPGTKAVVFAGDSLTLTHAIQSIMRLRGFLVPNMQQTIVWALSPQLRDKMTPAQKQFNLTHLLTWCLRNEAKAKKGGILLAAFQEISQLIEAIGFDPKMAVASVKKYANGYKDKVDPTALWSAEMTLEKTEKALFDYAEALYKRFGYALAFKQNGQLITQITKIINETKAKVEAIEINYNRNAALEMHQKSFVNIQIKKLIIRHDRTNMAPEPLRPFKKVTDADYVSSLKEVDSARVVFNTPQFSPHLFHEANQLHTAKVGAQSLKERFLKQVDFLVVIIAQKHFYAQAVSNDVAAEMVSELQKAPNDLQVPHKAMMIRANGKLYQKGAGGLKPTDAEVQTVLASPEMQDVLADVTVLNGRLPVNDRFAKRLQKWPQFQKLWDRIIKSLPFYDTSMATTSFHSHSITAKGTLDNLILNAGTQEI